ncbi:MAG: GNAT family N-acetyltransferase [Lysobacter sp.]|nr:GNAT family N-acetyltransferase [Lysobacter sp.]
MNSPAVPTDPTVHIRRAVGADADALTALTQRSRAYEGRYRAILEGYAITAAQVARDACHAAFDEDGGLLGYYSLVHDRVAGDAELDLLFVDDAAQGRGVGALLFAHMRKTARALGAHRVRIVSHPPAEPFYLRMGAVRVGEQPPRGRVAWARPLLELVP